jgi:hypothetical protein
VELSTWITIGSTLIAAAALFLNARELRLSHSAREIEGIFQLWDRYERYIEEYTNAKDGSKEKEQISLVNLLNFLENSALIYNRVQVPRVVRENIGALLKGYMDLIERDMSFIKVLDHYGTPHGNYEELRRYYARWKKSHQ